MKKFQDILVYAEADDAGCLAQVVSLARLHGAAVTLCEIVEPPPGIHDPTGIVDRVRELRHARAQQRLRQSCAAFPDQLIDYAVYEGVPFLSIAEQVLEQDFDLVVHISERLQGQTGVGLNATGMHLMRKCPTTIWALHPRTNHESNDVLLALDREVADETTGAEAFAMTVAESALSLAGVCGGNLKVAHAWRSYGHEVLDDPELGLQAHEAGTFRTRQREDTEQWFSRLTQRIQSIAPRDVAVEPLLLEGAAIPVIQQLTAEHAPGTLVLGTVGTSANPGVLIGPTAESILASCGTSVLALKPPGFVSPLARRAGA